jgi:molybdopterin converting factor small subunit
MAKVHFFAAARAAVGADVLDVSATSVADVIDFCSLINPQMSHLMPTCGILVDSVACHDFSAPVDADTRIDVLPKFAGG